jgi:hypothetical protein
MDLPSFFDLREFVRDVIWPKTGLQMFGNHVLPHTAGRWHLAPVLNVCHGAQNFEATRNATLVDLRGRNTLNARRILNEDTLVPLHKKNSAAHLCLSQLYCSALS